MDPKIQNFQVFKKRNMCYLATSRLSVYTISSQ